MKTRSLKSQLSFSFLLVVLVTVAMISICANVLINHMFRSYVRRQQEQKVQELVQNLGSQYERSAEQWDQEMLHMVGMYALYDGYILEVYDQAGIKIWDAWDHDMTLCNEIMTAVTDQFQQRYGGGGSSYQREEHALYLNERRIGSVGIGYYGPYVLGESDFQFLTALNWVLAGTGLVSFLLALVIGVAIADRITKPMQRAVSLTRRLSEGTYQVHTIESAIESAAEPGSTPAAEQRTSITEPGSTRTAEQRTSITEPGSTRTAEQRTSITERIRKQTADWNMKRAANRETEQLLQVTEELSRKLGAQEQLRARMLSDVAHELRTPLTTVRTHLEAMSEGIWEATPARLESCQDEIDRVSGLIKDLEKLHQLENGGIVLERRTVDLYHLAEHTKEHFALVAAEKEQKILVSGNSAPVWADREKMMQVLHNLVENALKYSGRGASVKIEVKCGEKTGSFCVTDEGIGISPEDIPFVFERFYRGEKSRNRRTGGAGIGLSIVKSIVSAHGGRVTAESIPGQGSSFTVLLPDGPFAII